MNLVIHLLMAALLPPLMRGVIIKTKAAFAGRVGAPLWQPYYDLIKLFQKDFVLSTTTSWVFLAGSVMALATPALAALLIPFGHRDAPVSFTGDVILFVYLLALGRFWLALASLDTGSSFEGMGAAREVTFACLAEPALFFGLLATARLSGSMRMADMFDRSLLAEWHSGAASLLLVIVSWFIVMLAENSRIPFDDPNTHLELTMIHEVMVLDHGGPALGMVLYGSAIKLWVFGTMIVRLAVPVVSGYELIDWAAFVAAMMLLSAIIGVVESVMARLKMTEVPKLLATACVLSALAAILGGVS